MPEDCWSSRSWLRRWPHRRRQVSAARGGAAAPAGAPVDAVSDRTACPGSAHGALTNLTGKTADLVEQAQWAYEDAPGFRAAIFDGNSVVIVVDASSLFDWAQVLDGTDTRTAVSCVDGAIIDAAYAIASEAKLGSGDYISAGYDGLRDAVTVTSTIAAGDVMDALTSELVKQGHGDLVRDVAGPEANGAVRIAQSEPSARR